MKENPRRDPSLCNTLEVSKIRSCQGLFRKGKDRIPLRACPERSEGMTWQRGLNRYLKDKIIRKFHHSIRKLSSPGTKIVDQSIAKINITIRKMTIDDIPEMRKIESLCFNERWHDGTYEDDLIQKNSYYIVARHKDKLAGYMGTWLIADEAHITTIAVSPEFRGYGIGKLLVWKSLNTAIDNGCRWATLEVSVKNESARKLYESVGFRGISNRKDYYENGEEAAIMLARNIQFQSFKNKLEKIRREWEQKICLSSE